MGDPAPPPTHPSLALWWLIRQLPLCHSNRRAIPPPLGIRVLLCPLWSPLDWRLRAVAPGMTRLPPVVIAVSLLITLTCSRMAAVLSDKVSIRHLATGGELVCASIPVTYPWKSCADRKQWVPTGRRFSSSWSEDLALDSTKPSSAPEQVCQGAQEDVPSVALVGGSLGHPSTAVDCGPLLEIPLVLCPWTLAPWHLWIRLLSALSSIGTCPAPQAVLISVSELVYKLIKEMATWKRVRSWHGVRVGFFPCIIALTCALGQFIITTVNYALYRKPGNAPIKISIWSTIFAFGQLVSSLSSSGAKTEIIVNQVPPHKSC
ncbi:hypothetical protein K2173_003997 [Erythroxylum novogranatense]|uniref:Uncharacterized protein n=1 Tax=Erythroxylum novogranatense TaxID=1862640 RepID=A0AAV8SJA5_9ROSI|nr:hypothetical protein K2173_003997 [Erythroxylum novogranatense]